MPDSSLRGLRFSRLELLVFIACFVAFGYFYQGGGWNQNARFAEVRAMVEEGRFAIDDFLVYQREDRGQGIRRIPVERAEFQWKGKRFRLAWVDMEWNLLPVGDHPLEQGVEKAPMVEKCASGDIGYVPKTGHFHPNKPPGTSFLAVPAYWVLYQVERALAVNPDQWWILTLNAWLTTVFSVGLISAVGSVVFYRLALDFAGGERLPAVLSTLAFAFGTTFFPFATILFDHDVTASLLLTAFYFARGKAGIANRLCVNAALIAGICAGFAAITNYIAAVGGAFVAIYILLRHGRRALDWRGTIGFSLGVLGPFLLICWYGMACFGSPFQLNTDFQNPLFKDVGAVLGMFQMPRADYVAMLTVSPFRGVFFLAPILIMAVYGVIIWMKEKRFLAEARLCLGVFGFFFLVNVSFNGYHGGYAAGPRYLIPGLPFLALPLVVAFRRFQKTSVILAIVSIVNQSLLTITDAQNPLAVGGHARNDQRNDFFNNLVGDYAWPLFAYGRAWPMLEQLLALQLGQEEERLKHSLPDASEVQPSLKHMEQELRAGIERGEPSPFLLASVRGPVSVNPIGVFEGLFTYSFFPPGSEQTRWASFNAGEFIWPESRWSILPVLLISGGAAFFLIRSARRQEGA